MRLSRGRARYLALLYLLLVAAFLVFEHHCQQGLVNRCFGQTAPAPPEPVTSAASNSTGSTMSYAHEQQLQSLREQLASVSLQLDALRKH